MKDLSKQNGHKTYEYVFDYFSNQILSGELKLNDRLPSEREVTEILGVSKTTVQEVLHMLEMNGLIECIQGKGSFVRCEPIEYMLKMMNMVMTLQHMHYSEIFEIRKGYEKTALDLAMVEARPEELDAMKEVLIKMDQIKDTKEGAALDVEFHNILIRASHNRMLVLYSTMMAELQDMFIKDLRTRILGYAEQAEILRISHWEIYDALIKKDYVAGNRALEKHFDVVGKELEKYKS